MMILLFSRLLWKSFSDHIYFRLQAKTREEEYAALGELKYFIIVLLKNIFLPTPFKYFNEEANNLSQLGLKNGKDY